jgi:hypothetical protein
MHLPQESSTHGISAAAADLIELICRHRMLKSPQSAGFFLFLLFNSLPFELDELKYVPCQTMKKT